MTRVTATEFARNLGRYREEAQREPVAITSHGRTTAYFVSAREYAELERLRTYELRLLRIEEVPADVFEAVVSTTRDPAHDHLDALLADW